MRAPTNAATATTTDRLTDLAAGVTSPFLPNKFSHSNGTRSRTARQDLAGRHRNRRPSGEMPVSTRPGRIHYRNQRGEAATRPTEPRTVNGINPVGGLEPMFSPHA